MPFGDRTGTGRERSKLNEIGRTHLMDEVESLILSSCNISTDNRSRDSAPGNTGGKRSRVIIMKLIP